MTTSCESEKLSKSLKKAVTALVEYEKKASSKNTKNSDKKSLFSEEDSASASDKAMYLVFGVKKVAEKASVKPIRLEISNSWKKEGSGVEACLFTKDPQADYKKKITALDLKSSVTKVIGVTKLRNKYKPYEAKRQLCASYDVFLADERILPLLPKLLGKKFFESKKIPVAVDLTANDLKAELLNAINCTYLHMSTGPCTSVKTALVNQSEKEIVENGLDVIRQVIAKIPRGWENINSIHLKTNDSISLPIYTADSQ